MPVKKTKSHKSPSSGVKKPRKRISKSKTVVRAKPVRKTTAVRKTKPRKTVSKTKKRVNKPSGVVKTVKKKTKRIVKRKSASKSHVLTAKSGDYTSKTVSSLRKIAVQVGALQTNKDGTTKRKAQLINSIKAAKK